MIRLVIPGQPERITEQQHRFGGYSKNGKAIIYRDARLQKARDEMLQSLMPYRPDRPLAGPIQLVVIWYFGTKTRKNVNAGWKTTRPDTDNMIKGLKDCLTECGYWEDDSQIVFETLAKRWTVPENARIEIVIKEMEA